MDRIMGNFRIVSEISYSGQHINVPNDAIDVTVQPLAGYGATRVTYLQRLTEVPFQGERDSERYIY